MVASLTRQPTNPASEAMTMPVTTNQPRMDGVKRTRSANQPCSRSATCDKTSSVTAHTKYTSKYGTIELLPA